MAVYPESQNDLIRKIEEAKRIREDAVSATRVAIEEVCERYRVDLLVEIKMTPQNIVVGEIKIVSR